MRLSRLSLKAFNLILNAELGILRLFFLLSWILDLWSLISKHKKCVTTHAPEGVPNLLASCPVIWWQWKGHSMFLMRTVLSLCLYVVIEFRFYHKSCQEKLSCPSVPAGNRSPWYCSGTQHQEAVEYAPPRAGQADTGDRSILLRFVLPAHSAYVEAYLCSAVWLGFTYCSPHHEDGIGSNCRRPAKVFLFCLAEISLTVNSPCFCRVDFAGGKYFWKCYSLWAEWILSLVLYAGSW